MNATNEIESEVYGRESMDLTSDQCSLVSAAVGSDSKTVAVNFLGSPFTLPAFIDHTPAFLQACSAGQECGKSVARVLLRDVNPSGRLPLSWPKCNEDNPAYGYFLCNDNDLREYTE